MSERRFPRPSLTRRPWGAQAAMVALLIVIGSSNVPDAVADPTRFNIFMAVLWVFAVAVYATSALREWRTGHRMQPEIQTGPVEVSDDAVAHSIASTPNRIAAIKTLREHNPGLGLRDAADLIDTALTAPEPPTI